MTTKCGVCKKTLVLTARPEIEITICLECGKILDGSIRDTIHPLGQHHVGNMLADLSAEFWYADRKTYGKITVNEAIERLDIIKQKIMEVAR